MYINEETPTLKHEKYVSLILFVEILELANGINNSYIDLKILL